MIDSQDAIRKAQDGTAPSNWSTLFAQKSYFTDQAGFCFLVVIGLLVVAIFLTFKPNVLIAQNLLLGILPGPISLFLNNNFADLLRLKDTGIWHIIDYIAIALAGIFFVLSGIDGLKNAKNPKSHLLILLPDGVILHKGEKTPTVINYAALNDLFITSYKKDKVKLTLESKDDGNEQTVEIDERFGLPKKLARDIIEAFRSYSDNQKYAK